MEDSRKWHQFRFDVDAELQWIKEHLPLATSTDYGKTLADAQNLVAKHKKLEVEVEGHEPVIKKALAAGQGLVSAGHFASADINKKVKELTEAWDDLKAKAVVRKRLLDEAVQRQAVS